MSGNIVGDTFLQQIVGSYIGALVQREHLKNKRLDDFITTTGNYQQASLQTSMERLNQKLGNASNRSGINVGPDVEYGDSPRQLGVTPFPQPPSSIHINEENSREEHSSQKNQTTSPSPEKEKPSQAERDDSSSPGTTESRESHVETRAKKGFPWLETIGGVLLASSLAGNGLMMYKAFSPEPSQQQQTQPASSSTTFSPSVEYNQQPGMGTVSIGVE
jgi:hypothetical protein